MAVTWILGRGSEVGYRNPVKIKPGRKEEERSKTNFIVSVGWPRINIWKKGSVLAAEGNSGHSPRGCSGAPLGLDFKSVWI